jgi:hypothetical protein
MQEFRIFSAKYEVYAILAPIASDTAPRMPTQTRARVEETLLKAWCVTSFQIPREQTKHMPMELTK